MADTATPTAPPLLTLPSVALACGASLDRVRTLFRTRPELSAMATRVGSAKCIRTADLERVRELLGRR